MLHRAEDLADELVEIVREKVRGSAPAPDPSASRPNADEWAAWADKNLPAQDAAIFRGRASESTAPADTA